MKTYLVFKKRRVISIPCVLFLSLAMGKTRIYEKPILSRPCHRLDIIKHSQPEICFHKTGKTKADCHALFIPTLYNAREERKLPTLEKPDLFWTTIGTI